LYERKKNAKLYRQQLKEMAISYAFTMWLIIVIFIIVFIAFFIFAVMINAILLGLASAGFWVTLFVNENGQVCVKASDNGDPQDIHRCVSYTQPIEIILLTGYILLQFCVAIWNLTLGIWNLLILLCMQVAAVLFKFIFGTALRYPAFQLANVGIQFLQVFVNAANSVSGRMGTTGIGAAFGATYGLTGVTVGANGEGGIAQFLAFLLQVVTSRMATFMETYGMDMFKWVDFLFTDGKYAPALFQSITNMASFFSTAGSVTQFLYQSFNMHYVDAGVAYSECEVQDRATQALCSLNNGVSGILNPVVDAVNSACTSCNLQKLPGCNQNAFQSSVCVQPNTNSLNSQLNQGLGECDVNACEVDVEDIISEIAQELPTCDLWVSPNSTSTIQCMAVVFYYSNNQSNNLATVAGNVPTPISAISKELCFVLTATIISQCNMGNQPFSFSYAQVANQVCNVDLSNNFAITPNPSSFTSTYACQYQAPLCPYAGCTQYSEHVLGQIFAMVGTMQCSVILTEYPESFWCQFSTYNSTTVLPQNDYTFSSVWCQAYLLFLEPLCSAEPFYNLNAIPRSGYFPSMVSTYIQTTCGQISNQTGVCLAINATVGSDIYETQYTQTTIDVNAWFAQNNALNAATNGGLTPTISTFNFNVPTNDTLPSEIQNVFVYQFPCQLFSIIFNNSNLYAQNGNTIEAVLSRYCDSEVSRALTAFNLLYSYTTFLTLQPNGSAPVVNLTGIPSGTSVFISTPQSIAATLTNTGVSPYSSNNAVAYNCPSISGSSPAELNQYQACSSSVQSSSQTSLQQATNTGSAALTTLQTTQATASPLYHMSQVDGFAPDPNSTNYELQVQDTTTLQSAQTLTTNVQYGYSADDTPQTSTYSAYTTPPPSETSIYANTPIYVNINSAGQRSVLSVDVDECNDEGNEGDEKKKKIELKGNEREEFQKSAIELKKGIDEFWSGIGEVFTNIINHKKVTEKHTLVGKMMEDRADFLERKIVSGPDDPNFFRRTKREILKLRSMFYIGNGDGNGDGAGGETTTTTTEKMIFDDIIFGALNDFEDKQEKEIEKEKEKEREKETEEDGGGSNRKLYSSTGNPQLDAQINARLYQLVTGTTGSNGMTQQQYEDFVGNNAYETLVTIKTSMQQVVIPRIYNMFWGIAITGSDYEFGFSPPNTTGNSANCHPTNTNPYACCQDPLTDPYACCKGLLGCMPMPSDNLKPGVTTEQNARYRWKCEDYRTYFSYIWQIIRTLYTAVTYVISLMTGVNIGFGIAYDNYIFPTNGGGCMILYSWYFALTILIFLFFMLLSLSFSAVAILTALGNKYEGLRAASAHLKSNKI
jgi:hypothetical protein